jgi:hypothetical protein
MPFIPHKGMKRASPGGNNTRAHTRHARQVQDRAAFVPTSPGPGTGTGDFLSNYGVNQEAQAERAFRHAFDTLNIDDTPILEREAGGTPLPTPKGTRDSPRRRSSDGQRVPPARYTRRMKTSTSHPRGASNHPGRRPVARTLVFGRATAGPSRTPTPTGTARETGPTSTPPRAPRATRAPAAAAAGHEQEVLDARTRRHTADALRQRYLDDIHTGPDYEKFKAKVAEFSIPGGQWGGGQRSCDPWLGQAHELLQDYRREGTWTRYLPSWRKATLLLTKWLSDDKHMFPQHPFWGFNVATLRLREARDYVTGVVAHTYYHSATMTGPSAMAYAINLACRINGIPVGSDHRVTVILEAAKRLRTKSIVKKAGFTFEEVKQINAKWGAHEQIGKRMISLAVCMGFLGLFRWADLAVINVGGIFFTEYGILVCVPIRKNQQVYPTWVAIADTKAPYGVVARLKRMLRDLGYNNIPEHGLIEGATEYLFRDVVPLDGHTHEHKRRDGFSPQSTGRRSMTKHAYSHYLSRFRAALVECCGFAKGTARDFGTHSVRSGGDTHLFNCGYGPEQRREVGDWATALVERDYLRLRCEQMFAMVRAAGL